MNNNYYNNNNDKQINLLQVNIILETIISSNLLASHVSEQLQTIVNKLNHLQHYGSTTNKLKKTYLTVLTNSKITITTLIYGP